MTTNTISQEITATLVLNQRLHLVVNGSTPACAGRRIRGAVVKGTATAEFPDLPVGVERANAWAPIRATAERAATADLIANLTDAHRANLCEVCANDLA